eukprot:2919553-Pleurochrysis_carterae.AAC.1
MRRGRGGGERCSTAAGRGLQGESKSASMLLDGESDIGEAGRAHWIVKAREAQARDERVTSPSHEVTECRSVHRARTGARETERRA